MSRRAQNDDIDERLTGQREVETEPMRAEFLPKFPVAEAGSTDEFRGICAVRH